MLKSHHKQCCEESIFKMDANSLKREAESLPSVPLKAATSYHAHSDELIQFVNDSLTADADINALIGNAPLQKMYDNHKHHAQFMATVFSLNEYDILVRTLPWVYRTYHSHNFSYDYFSAALKQWMAGVEKFLDPANAEPILWVYRWLMDMHKQIIAVAESDNLEPPPVHPDWIQKKSAFQAALLSGDHHHCLDIAEEMIHDSSGIEQFYSQIVQPSLYEIGMLWERAEISVAQEHLASAIVGRVMAAVGMNHLKPSEVKGKAVITASPNEFHEIGAWMISDTLEQDGWDVKYLGANTPQEDLIDMLLAFQPQVLAVSVTMSFNILKVRALIQEIRNTPKLDSLRIMVGGRVFNEQPDLWREIGGDGFASNLEEAKHLATQWHGSKNL